MFEYDVAVVGGGSAGYAAARTALQAGLKAVVIEGGAEVGGLCILRGCMPTKALLYSAEVFHLVRQGSVFGIGAKDPTVDFKAVMARKDKLVAGFAAYRREQLEAGKFDFVRAEARFLDAHTLDLHNGRKLTARSFVISTGSVVGPSPVTGLDKVRCLTSDTALRLDNPPRSLIVLGGGAVAVEFAQFFARIGTQVTIIQRSEHLLKEEDIDASSEIAKVLRREGITLFTGTALLDARMEDGAKAVAFTHQGGTQKVVAEEILFSLGRVPNTRGLGLEEIGVKLDARRIVVDAGMQSGVPHIFAAGDCTGLHEIVHIAVQQGEIAAHNIAFPARRKTMDDRLLTSVVFTDPQIARVGLTEKEARRRGISFLSASYPFNDHGKSMIMEALDGFVKLLADPKSGEILGGACVGPVAGELIHEIIAAMSKRMTVHELAAMPHYHPTLAEIWTYPAEEIAGRIT